MNLEHYLTTLTHKPGALSNSSALRSSRNLNTMYETDFRGSEKDFISVLLYCRDNKITHNQLFKLYELAKTKCTNGISADILIAYLGQPKETIAKAEEISNPGNTEIISLSQQTLNEANHLLNNQ
jgi:hypothetical protein